MIHRLVAIYFTSLMINLTAVWANNFLDDETNQGILEVSQTFRGASGRALTVYLFLSLYLARAPPSKTLSPLD